MYCLSMAKNGRSGGGGRGQSKGKLALTLPMSCRRHNPWSKRLRATIDEGAQFWKVHATACSARRTSPQPPVTYSCRFCSRPFSSAKVLGGHMNLHRSERMAIKARDKQAAVAAVAAKAAKELQACNETAAAAATTTPKIPLCPEFAAEALEVLHPAAMMNQDPGMALMRMLNQTPELGTIIELPPPPLLSSPLPELSTITELCPPPFLSLPLPELSTISELLTTITELYPPPLLSLPLPKLSTITELCPPPLSSLPLLQTKSSLMVLDPPLSSGTTAEFFPQQSADFSLWQRRSSPVVPTAESTASSSSSKRAFHPYERGLVKMGRFSVMASAPVDLELRLGRNPTL